MTTTLTPTAPATASSAAPAAGRTPTRDLSFGRIVQAEWIKFRTLRANWITLGAAVAVMALFGALAAAVSASGGDLGGPEQAASTPLSITLTGSMFGVLVLGVLGCLHGAREFGSSMMTATLTAAPRRLQVLAAKAVVLTGVVLPAALTAAFGAWAIGSAVQSAGGEPTSSLSDGAVLGSLLGTAFWLTAVALIGTGLGVLVRSTAGAISALVAGVLIVPALAGGLLPDSWSMVLDYLPSNAATTFTTLGPDSSLGTAAGLAVVAGWVVVALVAAGARFRSSDL